MRSEPSTLPVSLPPRPEFLAGREALLTDLHTLLVGENQMRPRTAVLSGLGGVGKTSVAAEYAHRHLAEVAVAWQLAAEDRTVLTAEFGLLAAQLGIRAVADVRDPVRSVHSALAAHPTDWLLIFDNAPDAGSLHQFLPPVGRGRVIITSQDATWPTQRVLDVPVLDRQVAAEFLVNRTTEPDPRGAKELADELGGLPLALEQAASYVKATGASLADYLELFRARRSDVLQRGEIAGHPATVAATLGLALSRLDADAPAAAALLRLLACLAPEPIPLTKLIVERGVTDALDGDVAALIEPLFADQLARRDAVAALRRYSLVTPAGIETVVVHRLVQAVTLDEIGLDQARAWREAAAALIESSIPRSPDLPATWPTCASLLPHAQAVLAYHNPGMSRLGDYLSRRGMYSAALDLWRKIAAAKEQVLGAEHPDTLAARVSLALQSGEAGNPATARDMLAELLPIDERVLGWEHPSTLSVRGALARWTGQAGDREKARDMYVALLPDMKGVLGRDDLESLATRHNLAHQTGGAGEPLIARNMLAELLPDVERILGADHQDAMTVRASLAHWTGEAGDPATARDKYADLLIKREQVLGREHPDTLRTRHNLAVRTGQAGDPVAARDMLAALLPVEDRVLGPEHPDTLRSRLNHAVRTGEAGSPAAARDLLQELLPVAERVLGRTHPDAKRTRANLAYWMRQANDSTGLSLRCLSKDRHLRHG